MRLSEDASRRLFLAQFVVLAAPAIVVFAFYGVLVGGMALLMLAAFAFSSLTSGDGPGGQEGAFSMLAMIGVAVVAPALGLVAIVFFCRVSLAFWRGGRKALCGARPLFWKGLAYGALPIALMIPIGVTAMAVGNHWVDAVFGLYFSGLVLFPPLAHLGLEARAARTNS